MDTKMNDIISLAKKISSGDYNSSLELARMIRALYTPLSKKVGKEELLEKYGTIVVVEDAIDDAGIPLNEEVRSRWNQESLRKLDQELHEIIEFYKKDIISESQKLIEEK